MSRKREPMSWEIEFEPSFKVPEEILRLVDLGVLEDSSWHNDVAPSFTAALPGGEDMHIRLWVDHPNRKEREGSGDRYWLNVYEGATHIVDVFGSEELRPVLAVLKYMIVVNNAKGAELLSRG